MAETTHTHNLSTEFDRIIIASDEENAPFTVAIIPDVQFFVSEPYTDGKIDGLVDMVDWIIDNKETENIKMVAQIGDLTHHNGTGFVSVYPDDPEYDRVKPLMDKIDDADMPLLIIAGNHEYDSVWHPNDLEAFNYYFPDTRFTDKSWYGGQYEEGKSENVWYKIMVRGVEYIFIGVEFLPRLEVLAWCNQIAEDNPDSRIIYFSHDYLYGDSITGIGYLDSGTNPYPYYSWTTDITSPPRSSGGTQFKEFVFKQPNIIAVYGGHRQFESVVLQSVGQYGNIVTQFGHDYSVESVKDEIVLLSIDPKWDRATQRVYSPSLDQEINGYAQDFSFRSKPIFE